MSTRGKVALITYARVDSAWELARDGAQLAIHYNSTTSKDVTVRLRDELQRRYPGIVISLHGGDLGTAIAVEHIFGEVLRIHHRIDIVVNSSGTILRKPVTHVSNVDYSKMFAYTVFVDEQRRKSVQRYHDTVQGLPSTA